MKRKRNKLLIIIGIIILLILGGAFGAYKYINRVKNVKLQGSDEELKISQETQEKSEKENIENILLLGVDKEENASDTIMVLSLDKDDNTAKLTSVMRDLNVDLGESNKVHKINYAYHYGGVEGSVSALNKLFDLDINKYVKIDFEGLKNVIDYIGGIELSVTAEESRIIGLSKSGNVKLNGKQALEYSRIRKIDNDYYRTNRQRKVIMAIFNKAKSIEVTSYPKIISDLSSNIETNLSTFELLDLGKGIMSMNAEQLEGFRIPIDGSTKDLMDKGIYYLGWDEEVNKKALHNFIYGEN